MALISFDFTGSGNSEGDYVTLGWNEQHDMECIVDYLVGLNKFTNLFIWGRSMGAVTALLYALRGNNKISALICDSPFSNLRKLAKDVAS